jgi:hypothetical protein
MAVTFDTIKLIPGILLAKLSSMHVVLHRRESVARPRWDCIHHITGAHNTASSASSKLPNATLSNQYENKSDHGFVNTPQSILEAPE